MPAISVIIPLYNKAKYISRALKSVFIQNFQDFEVIVVDDGSTDNGLQVAQTYKDRRLRFVSQTNKGPGAARNKGVEISRSRYLTFLDADDQWIPQFLQTSFDNLLSCKDCALSVTGHYVGREKSLWPGMKILHITKGPWRLGINMNPRLMGTALAFIHSAGAVLCRRDVLEKFGGFYENGCRYGEDLYLWLRVILNYRIFRDPTPLFIQHTEVSKLVSEGWAIDKTQSLMPFLTDPEPIRQNCPHQYKMLLERFLANQALWSAHECAFYGNLATAHELVENYPLMKLWPSKYLKLKYKVTFPKTMQLLRKLRTSLTATNKKYHTGLAK